MNEKIKLLKKIFKENNYELTEKEINDLRTQLKLKAVQLYLKAIQTFKENSNNQITYEKICEMIKNDIRIRNMIRDIITPLEESIRTENIDNKFKLTEVKEYFDFLKNFNDNNLKKIINSLKNNLYDDIRLIRNDVSHISYPIIFNDFEIILKRLNNIKKIDFVDGNKIDELIKKVNIISQKNKFY